MQYKPSPRVAIYVRQSAATQGPSLCAGQTAVCAELANALGGVIVNSYTDEGAGCLRNQPELQKMLHDAKHTSIDLVICDSLDRLSRNTEDLAWLGRQLSDRRIQLQTVRQGHIDEVQLSAADFIGSFAA